MARRMTTSRRPDDNQLAHLRAGAHADVDLLADHRADLDRWAREWAGELGRGGGGAGPSSSDATLDPDDGDLAGRDTVSRPTERAALATSTDAARDAEVALVLADQAFDALRSAADAVRRLLPASQSEVESMRGRQTSTAGACVACGRDVSGSARDRLRAGFCDACRKAWEREGKPDRAAFIARRRAAQADPACGRCAGRGGAHRHEGGASSLEWDWCRCVVERRRREAS